LIGQVSGVATATNPASTQRRTKSFFERWYLTGMAILMIAVSIAGFLPAIVNPVGRRAPLTLLAAVHGIVFLAWLLLFLAQTLLAATGRVGWHRRVGYISVVLLTLMIVLGFQTTTAMVRRGFDLSGDLHVDPHPQIEAGGTVEMDAATASVFNFAGLLIFAVLAIAAICYRRRPEIHKRLMLFANIELMQPPSTHLLGHFPPLALSPGTALLSFSIFLVPAVARDWLVARRIHPLTAALAIALFLSLPIEGAVIGPSAAWRQFAAWLSQ
jgi:hypothetical protein